MIAPHIPNILKVVTIMPARHIPIKMQSSAGKNFIPKIYAAMLPVHAPVTGKGIMTKSMSPNASYFFIRAPFRLVLAKSHSKNFLKKGIREGDPVRILE